MNRIAAIAIVTVTTMLVLAASPMPRERFSGVTLGETTQQLITERGDPLQVFDRPGDLEYAYLTTSGNALQFATIDNGNVVSVEVVTIPPFSEGPIRQSAVGISLHDDPSALAVLGAPRAADAAERRTANGTGPFRGPDGLDYYFSSGRIVTGITAQLPLAQRSTLAVNAVAPVIHEGRTFDDAIVIKADTEGVGVRAEREYLSYHRCSSYGGAQVQQALITRSGKPYDRLSATGCQSSDANRDYYFDISSFFGKL